MPIGEPAAANVGITAFSTRRREDKQDRLQAFARLENFGPQTVTAEVELYRDELADRRAKSSSSSRNGSGGVVFELGDVHAGVLEAADSLRRSARRSTTRPGPRSIRRAAAKVLLVTPGNEALAAGPEHRERARKLADVEIAEPEFLETKEYQAEGRGGLLRAGDLRPVPAQADAAGQHAVHWPAAARAIVDRRGSQTAAPQIIDVDTAHPLMQLIDLGNVKFAEALAAQAARRQHAC